MRTTTNESLPSLFGPSDWEDDAPEVTVPAAAVRKEAVPAESPPPGRGATASTNDDLNLQQKLKNRVIKAFLDLYHSLGESPETVFDHWLEFILHGWQVQGSGLTWWKYTEEETKRFIDTYETWISALAEMLQSFDWYDFLGEIYENVIAGALRKKGKGQFFTPMHVCDCMAMITMSVDSKDETISDPCCGSGRMLLASHAENPSAVAYAKDLDRTCVLMTACNFLVHGVRGVVTHGDSLKNEDWETWYVNPFLGDGESPLFGVPHCLKAPDAGEQEKASA